MNLADENTEYNMTMELFVDRTGTKKMEIVPYKGAAGMLADLIGVGKKSRLAILPDVTPQLKKVGFEITPGTPEKMRATRKADYEFCGQVVKRVGVKQE